MSAARTSRRLRARAVDAAARASGRILTGAWPLLQGALAATAAWVIARYGLGHPEPFFAPVAAVIALNSTLGERGLHAVRLLHGVVIGIAVGELALLLLGQGYGTLGLATLVATTIAHGIGGARITVAQAAVGAILTIVVGDPDAGLDRFVDALAGAGVALVFSQVLFPPEPVALVRRAEAAALRELADALDLTARGLEEDDEEAGKRAIEGLRTTHERLAEVGRMQLAGTRVARRSLAWRSRAGLVVRENENAGHLDLLGVSCLMLTRVAPSTSPPDRRFLAAPVRDLARALADLADSPGDRDTRQGAVDRALEGVLHPLRTRVAGDVRNRMALGSAERERLLDTERPERKLLVGREQRDLRPVAHQTAQTQQPLDRRYPSTRDHDRESIHIWSLDGAPTSPTASSTTAPGPVVVVPADV